MQYFSKLRDLPQLTHLGFKKMTIPPEIWSQVTNIYDLVKHNKVPEPPGICIENKTLDIPSIVMPIWDRSTECNNLLNSFYPVLHEWSNIDIKPLCIYGIRTYHRGSTLTLHVDKIESHHVSAIVCVDKNVDTDWALNICDHFGAWHKVYLNPGEMVLYESALCQHARLDPLDGEGFTNMFVHYSLSNYEYKNTP